MELLLWRNRTKIKSSVHTAAAAAKSTLVSSKQVTELGFQLKSVTPQICMYSFAIPHWLSLSWVKPET